MSTAIGAALPDLLLSRLDAQRAEEPSESAVLLSTSDEHGFPHPALLSYGEIDARGPSMLNIGVYAASVTATNLRRDRRATLSFVDEQGAWYVKATVAGDERPHQTKAGVAVFPLTVITVLTDAVDTSREAPARIVSGIRFRRGAPPEAS
jgi:hypothetical protein